MAHAARAIVRAVLLAVLEQETMTRVHVGWQVTEQELRATVRDDGQGALSMCNLSPARISDRLDVLGGRLDVDAVPGRGTTVTAVIPLTTPDAPAPTATDPLGTLGAREVEVLTRLGVGSRGEAGALFHAAA